MFDFLSHFFQKLLRFRSDFQNLFFRNEYQTLCGSLDKKGKRSNKKLLTLAGILLLTFLALSFAIGSLEQLSTRMNNPFTNWVNLSVDRGYQEALPLMKLHFDEKSNRDSFFIKNYSPYSPFPMKFIRDDNQEIFTAFGRTVEPEDDLTKKILGQPSNGAGLAESDFCGLIVTEKLLEELNYNAPMQQQKILVAFPNDGKDDGYINVYIDIVAIVKELPDKAKFACHPRLYNINLKPFYETDFIETRKDSYSFEFLAEKPIAEAAQKAIENRHKNLNKLKETPININNFEKWQLYEAFFEDLHSIAYFSNLFDSLQTDLKGVAKTQFYIPTDCQPKFEDLENPNRVAFNFGKLIKVRDFKDYLKENFDMEISMAQVESKENFALVSRLTFIISVVLFFFGTASIVFFVDSLLKTHLQKVKMNLGTFKAFGLDNQFLVTTYLKIIFVFLSIATFVALVIVGCLVGIEETIFEESHFNLFNGWVLLAIVLLFAISLLQSWRTIRQILTNTPGDLIYNRV